MYNYAKLKTFWVNILSRSNFEEMLRSDNVETAVKSIAHKPIGVALYEVVSKNTYSLRDLDIKLSEFNHNRLKQLRELVDWRERIYLDLFDAFFDTLNLYFIMLNLKYSRPGAVIYPVGRLVDLDLESVKSIDDLEAILPESLQYIYDKLKLVNIENVSNVFMIVDSIIDRGLIENPLLVRIYGFLHDILLVKTCFFTVEPPAYTPHLYTLTLNEFSEACSVRELQGLTRVLQGFNPLYNRFSSVLNDLFSNVKVSFEIFDLAVFLHLVNETSDLIYGLNQVALRTYLIFLSEVLLTRTVLSAIDSKMYIDGLKSIVSKWWIL